MANTISDVNFASDNTDAIGCCNRADRPRASGSWNVSLTGYWSCAHTVRSSRRGQPEHHDLKVPVICSLPTSMLASPLTTQICLTVATVLTGEGQAADGACALQGHKPHAHTARLFRREQPDTHDLLRISSSSRQQTDQGYCSGGSPFF